MQGQIGTCFLLGAIGAIVARNEKVLEKVIIKHSVDAGVYGVRFCLDGEWIYTVVDDYFPVDEFDRLLYSQCNDENEVWLPIIEKAFCKLHTCYEMCDGGMASEAISSFFWGGGGKLLIKKKHRKNPMLQNATT